MGGGVTIDMGIYATHLLQWVFQEEPSSIKATGVVNEDGVDVEMYAELNYGENRKGRVRTSVINTWPEEATIVGTKGSIKVISKCFDFFFRKFKSIIEMSVFTFFHHAEHQKQLSTLMVLK